MLSKEEKKIYEDVVKKLKESPAFRGIYDDEIILRIKQEKSVEDIYQECLDISIKTKEEELPY